MRDPKRIEKVLSTIRRIWYKNPDLRLCQMIGNVVDSINMYYVEDDELIKRLEDLEKLKLEINGTNDHITRHIRRIEKWVELL